MEAIKNKELYLGIFNSGDTDLSKTKHSREENESGAYKGKSHMFVQEL